MIALSEIEGRHVALAIAAAVHERRPYLADFASRIEVVAGDGPGEIRVLLQPPGVEIGPRLRLVEGSTARELVVLIGDEVLLRLDRFVLGVRTSTPESN